VNSFSGSITDPSYNGGTAATFTFLNPQTGVDVSVPASPNFTTAVASFIGIEGTGFGVGDTNLGRFTRGESVSFKATHAFSPVNINWAEFTGDEVVHISWTSGGVASSAVVNTTVNPTVLPTIVADANTNVVITNVSAATANSSGRLRFNKIHVALVDAPVVGIPSPWVHQNVGTFTPTGTSSYAGGTFTLNTGNGLALMDAYTADAFTYVYQPATGDCSITARVASLACNDGLKGEAGVMIRESVASNSKFAMIGVTTGRGLQFTRRTTAGAGNVSTAGPGGVAPQWLRITRVGDVFTAYRSTDNVTWTQVGTPQTITMAASVSIGLPLCNHGGSGSGTFDSITVTP
jgi:hypothetical protein